MKKLARFIRLMFEKLDIVEIDRTFVVFEIFWRRLRLRLQLKFWSTYRFSFNSKIHEKSTYWIANVRSTDRTVRDREKWVDVRARTSIENKEKMRQKRRKSWTKLLRVHKRKELTRKYDKDEISLQEMIAPPEELAVMMEDVKRAKREIQETGRARTKIRKPAKKTWESRLVAVPSFSKLDFDRSDFRILFTEFHFFVKLCRELFLISHLI